MRVQGSVFLVLSVACLVASPGGAQSSVSTDILKNLEWRNIGPANMMGRVADVEGVPGNPNVVYVGSASGGVWKTTDGGVSFKPIFDRIPYLSIGDVALEPGNPEVLYVGTGEGNPRNSVSFGNGVYKSTDGGGSWRHLGLSDTRNITRIVINPREPGKVYVAALGHLFGPSAERGVFRSLDGGQSWEKVLFVDDRHGAADLDIDPVNPNILYAALWYFDRKPWTHTSGSEKGGVFKSVDGGATWKKIEKGLPKLMGRIGVKVAASNPAIVYVIAESNEGTLYRSDDQGESFTAVNKDPNLVNRGLYYTDLRVDPQNENRIYVVSSSLQRSLDGGKTFETFSRTTHVDYHALWIDRENPRRMWQGQDGGVAVSYNQGETWEYVNHFPLAQFYQIYADNREPFYYVGGGLQDNGTWSGPSRNREPFGILNDDWRMVSFGDGFHIVSDPTDPEVFLSESQGGGLYRTDMKSREQIAASPQPRRGDGGPAKDLPYRFNWNAPIVASPRGGRTVYFGGNVVFRTDDFGMAWRAISPDLSTNDPEKLQTAGGPIFTENTTAEYHGTVISLAESPAQAGVLWAGTDDGNLQVSRNGGEAWENVVKNVPGVAPFSPVSHVEPSRTAAGTAYAAFDRHMFDDFRPYLFKTTDFGKTWKAASGGLPDKAYVHVLREDPKNPRVLYAGTELGLFVSFDEGARYSPLGLKNLPAVSVHDILIHPRENDIVLGTHGRGLWILDDATPIQTIAPNVLAGAAHLFPVRPALRFTIKPTRYGIGDKPFRGPNPPYGALITYHLKDKVAEGSPFKMEVLDARGQVIRTLTNIPREAGVHRVTWDLATEEPRPRREGPGDQPFFSFGPRGPQVPPGTYRLKLTAGSASVETEIVVRVDPTVTVSAADLGAQYEQTTKLRDLRSSVNDVLRALDGLRAQIEDRRKAFESQRRAIPEELGAAMKTALEDLDKTVDGLARPSGRPFWSEGPRLSERLSDLFGQLNGVLGRPTAAQSAYFSELLAEHRSKTTAANELLVRSVASLDALLAKHGAPRLLLPVLESR